VTYPDPILKQSAEACGQIDAHVAAVCRDLADTMRANERCVGLAAPQIGESLRIVVIDVSQHPLGAEANHGLLVLVNPHVLEANGLKTGREGCLSIPQITANVARAVRVSFTALGPFGEAIESVTSGFEARALQHEVDHLDGILILDRVASPSELFTRGSP